MHGHMSKHVKMHGKLTDGTNKHGKQSIAWSGKREGTHRVTSIMVMYPKWLHPNKASWALDVTTQPPNPLRASSVAKPRTREAKMLIKYRRKQA